MQGKDDVKLTVATPKGVFTGTFLKTAKVRDVITTIIAAMGLDGGTTYELVHGDKVLAPPERPLVSFQLEGHVELDLVGTGQGV